VASTFKADEAVFIVDFFGGASFVRAACDKAATVVVLDHHKTAAAQLASGGALAPVPALPARPWEGLRGVIATCVEDCMTGAQFPRSKPLAYQQCGGQKILYVPVPPHAHQNLHSKGHPANSKRGVCSPPRPLPCDQHAHIRTPALTPRQSNLEMMDIHVEKSGAAIARDHLLPPRPFP